MEGQTQGRMEGIESLQNTLHAYYSDVGFGHGPGFGWSSQHHRWISHQQKLNSMRHLMVSASTQHSNMLNEKLEKQRRLMDSMDVERQYEQEAHKRKRFGKILNILYILIGIASFLGFAYYVEIIKINTFQAYLPNGISLSKSVETVSENSETIARRQAMALKQKQQP